jgi:molybdopterin-guanine dinucleotide biosynthesis protein A
MLAPDAVTLGILAGGRATRLGGRDKAWIERDGVPQVLRHVQTLAGVCGAVLVSANRGLPRYPPHGLRALPDVQPDLGPLGGLQALAAACETPWLFTLPVDVLRVDAQVLRMLVDAGAGEDGQGAVAQDNDGLQPLVALYRVAALRAAVAAAIAAGEYSVKALQAALSLPTVVFSGPCFGNLNTPADLAAAGCAPVDGA